MYTIRSTNRGIVLGHYGTFGDLATAQQVTANVTRIAHSKFGTTSTYTAVPLPAGVTAKPLHPSYTA
jgi:hypothetical protein